MLCIDVTKLELVVWRAFLLYSASCLAELDCPTTLSPALRGFESGAAGDGILLLLPLMPNGASQALRMRVLYTA